MKILSSILDNYVFMLQLTNTDDKVIMKCHYGCCSYVTTHQAGYQQLQCREGCYKPYPIPPLYPVYLVVNQHCSSTSMDMGITWSPKGIPMMPINRDQRLPMISIPQPPDNIDLKIVGPTLENETVVL